MADGLAEDVDDGIEGRASGFQWWDDLWTLWLGRSGKSVFYLGFIEKKILNFKFNLFELVGYSFFFFFFNLEGRNELGFYMAHFGGIFIFIFHNF